MGPTIVVSKITFSVSQKKMCFWKLSRIGTETAGSMKKYKIPQKLSLDKTEWWHKL